MCGMPLATNATHVRYNNKCWAVHDQIKLSWAGPRRIAGRRWAGHRSERVARSSARATGSAVFLFLYFLFPFFTKIYFQFGNLQKYTPAAPLPGGRDLAAGGRGLPAKKRRKQIADRSLGTGRPAAGRPASQAARLRGGRHFFLQFIPFREIISHMCPFYNFLQK